MSATRASIRRPAPTERKIHPLLRERWSPHAFSGEPVEPEKIQRLLEAARWAPSSFNEQPWRFLVASRRRNPRAYEKLADVLAEGNRAWAENAPVLVLTAAEREFSFNGEENPHAWHDVGIATAQLTLQATEEGLGVHPMAGFDAEAAREAFAIPKSVDPVAVVAVGYPDRPDDLPEELAERETAPRERRPLDEIVAADDASDWSLE